MAAAPSTAPTTAPPTAHPTAAPTAASTEPIAAPLASESASPGPPYPNPSPRALLRWRARCERRAFLADRGRTADDAASALIAELAELNEFRGHAEGAHAEGVVRFTDPATGYIARGLMPADGPAVAHLLEILGALPPSPLYNPENAYAASPMVRVAAALPDLTLEQLLALVEPHRLAAFVEHPQARPVLWEWVYRLGRVPPTVLVALGNSARAQTSDPRIGEWAGPWYSHAQAALGEALHRSWERARLTPAFVALFGTRMLEDFPEESLLLATEGTAAGHALAAQMTPEHLVRFATLPAAAARALVPTVIAQVAGREKNQAAATAAVPEAGTRRHS